MVFEEVLKELYRRKIRYLVAGGVAVNLHGFPRVTADLDLLLSLEEENTKKFIDMIKSFGWKPRIPVKIEEFANPKSRESWIKEKGLKAFSVYNPKMPLEHIDILINVPTNFEKAFKEKKVINASGFKILLIPLSELISLKKKAGRARDLIDIDALNQIKGSSYGKKKKKR